MSASSYRAKRSTGELDAYRNHFSDDCLFVNGLGPTEATVSLQNFIDKRTNINTESVPVGFPVEDTTVLLLKSCRQTQRKSTARSPSNPNTSPWATGKTQPPPPPRSAPMEVVQTVRIYRTGDMGRRLPDGRIKFEGRKDFQVKIRVSGLSSARSKPPSRSTRMCAKAWLSPIRIGREKSVWLPTSYSAKSKRQSTVSLRDFPDSEATEYMVPTSFVVLGLAAVNRQRKLNRRALPAPDSHSDQAPAAPTRPQTHVENLARNDLGRATTSQSVGVTDNFFELGGHSFAGRAPLRPN